MAHSFELIVVRPTDNGVAHEMLWHNWAAGRQPRAKPAFRCLRDPLGQLRPVDAGSLTVS